MQLGHIAVAVSIASYNWNPKTIVFVGFMHFLPNFDVLPLKLGWAKRSFHCTITHTFLFALIVSAIALQFGNIWGILAIVSLLTHYLADMGSTVGQPLFYPLSKKKYTWALFKDTGPYGMDSFVGYYSQPMSWGLEVPAFSFAIYRLLAVYGVIPDVL